MNNFRVANGESSQTAALALSASFAMSPGA